MTFFSYRLSFVSFICKVTGDTPFLHLKIPISQPKNPLEDLCLVSSYFASHPITLVLKILGDGCMGRPQPQILGAVLPVPLSLRPCNKVIINVRTLLLRCRTQVCSRRPIIIIVGQQIAYMSVI